MTVKASDSITLVRVTSITDKQAADIEETKETAQSIKNYFFYDDDGAHVTTTEGDAATGNNVLIDSDGMQIRDGETMLASFGANIIEIGKNNVETKINMCKQALTITGSQDGQENNPVGMIVSMGDMAIASNGHMGIFGMTGVSISAGATNSVISMGADTVTINEKPIQPSSAGQATLTYIDSTTLKGYIYFSKKVKAAIATIEYLNGTPFNQVDRLYTQCNSYNANGRVEIFAIGSGFVSGHVLKVNVAAYF